MAVRQYLQHAANLAGSSFSRRIRPPRRSAFHCSRRMTLSNAGSCSSSWVTARRVWRGHPHRPALRIIGHRARDLPGRGTDRNRRRHHRPRRRDWPSPGIEGARVGTWATAGRNRHSVADGGAHTERARAVRRGRSTHRGGGNESRQVAECGSGRDLRREYVADATSPTSAPIPATRRLPRA